MSLIISIVSLILSTLTFLIAAAAYRRSAPWCKSQALRQLGSDWRRDLDRDIDYAIGFVKQKADLDANLQAVTHANAFPNFPPKADGKEPHVQSDFTAT